MNILNVDRYDARSEWWTSDSDLVGNVTVGRRQSVLIPDGKLACETNQPCSAWDVDKWLNGILSTKKFCPQLYYLSLECNLKQDSNPNGIINWNHGCVWYVLIGARVEGFRVGVPCGASISPCQIFLGFSLSTFDVVGWELERRRDSRQVPDCQWEDNCWPLSRTCKQNTQNDIIRVGTRHVHRWTKQTAQLHWCLARSDSWDSRCQLWLLSR